MGDFSKYMELIKNSQTIAIIVLLFSVTLFVVIVIAIFRMSKLYRNNMKNSPLQDDLSENI